jgi:hypothetical protein
MKFKQPAYAIIPYHISGYRAPAICVTADTYEQAKKEASKRCTLTQRFPHLWQLI